MVSFFINLDKSSETTELPAKYSAVVVSKESNEDGISTNYTFCDYLIQLFLLKLQEEKRQCRKLQEAIRSNEVVAGADRNS